MKHTSGFVLSELIVVVTIMAILVAVALPSLQSFRNRSAQKAAARKVLLALRLARTKALSQNREYQVAFDLDTPCLWLEKGNLSRNSSSWQKVRDFGSFGGNLKMAATANCSVTAGDGDPDTAERIIQFNPAGTANALYICVLGADGSKKYRSGVPSSISGRTVINRWDVGASAWK